MAGGRTRVIKMTARPASASYFRGGDSSREGQRGSPGGEEREGNRKRQACGWILMRCLRWRPHTPDGRRPAEMCVCRCPFRGVVVWVALARAMDCHVFYSAIWSRPDR
jgi:hypothetical protein